MNINVFVANLSQHYAEMKLHHWFSENYQQHIILDEYNQEYLEAYDTLTEYYIENTQQDELDDSYMTLKIKTNGKYSIEETISSIINHQSFLRTIRSEETNNSIVSIIDDIIILQEQTIYRLRKVK